MIQPGPGGKPWRNTARQFRRTIARHIASLAHTLDVGPLADCFVDPATALCLKGVTSPDPMKPLTALCEPSRCPNVCIGERHGPAWEKAAADTRALLGEPLLSDLQRQQLSRELDRLTSVIAAIEP